ncbi:MAG: phosphoesterase PA-phosphatase related protein [Gemmatimonadetes bacterium]|nr:phosphoesterase PA-phosphatase related protein [Gemmatimonadota bacterium]
MTGSEPHRTTVPEPPRSRLRTILRDRVDPKTYLGLHLTIGLAVAALALWLFSALLDAVLDNDALVRWDMAADAAIHARMTPSDLRLVDFATQLGSPVAMTLLGIVVAVLLWRTGRRTLLIGWSAAFVGGAIIGQILKMVVHRTRPVYGAAYLHGQSFSFPSGHAMGSIIGYGMLVYLLRQLWHAGGRRRAVELLAVLFVVAVGLSRVLLGVHYPSDVVGGWAAGAAWMAVCIAGIGISRQREMDRTHPVAAALLDTAGKPRADSPAP